MPNTHQHRVPPANADRLRNLAVISVVLGLMMPAVGLSGPLSFLKNGQQPAKQANETGAHEGDPRKGAVKAGPCEPCHALDGNAEGQPAQTPKLAGQHPDYLQKQLQDFADGVRTGGHPDMLKAVNRLSDKDIADVAAWYGAQIPAFEEADPQVALPGRGLFTDGRLANGVAPCATCHGQRGQGFPGMTPGGYPMIGGQRAAYLFAQLVGFRDGARTNDAQRVMQRVVTGLSDDELRAVAEYASGMSPKEIRTKPRRRATAANDDLATDAPLDTPLDD